MMKVSTYNWVLRNRDKRQVALNYGATYVARAKGYYFSIWPKVNPPQERHWRVGRKPIKLTDTVVRAGKETKD